MNAFCCINYKKESDITEFQCYFEVVILIVLCCDKTEKQDNYVIEYGIVKDHSNVGDKRGYMLFCLVYWFKKVRFT